MNLSLPRWFSASILLSLFALAPMANAAELNAATTLEENLDHVVKVWCGYIDDDGFPDIYSEGSGVILEDNLVLTNAHVAFYLDEFDSEGTFYYYDFCWGGLAPNSFTEPTADFTLDYSTFNWNAEYDYAFMEAYDTNAVPLNFETGVSYGNPDSLVHGDDMTLIGYPSVGGSTITSTFGAVSGFDGPNWIKTDAVAEFGSSGGGAFDALGNFVGLPTIVTAGELNSFTFVQNINAIIEDAFPVGTIERDYNTLYTADNIVCFSNGDCFNFGEGDEIDLGADPEPAEQEAETFDSEMDEHMNDLVDEPVDPSTDEPEEDEPVVSLGSEIEEGAYVQEEHDQVLIDRLEGQILLQTDVNGEAWYVNPDDGLRYYMRDGDVAYQMMRLFSLGITDADLETIPSVDTVEEMLEKESICSSHSLADRLKGDILLQVESVGEAHWIHPDKCYRIYMEDGDAAYTIMRFLSLGVLSSDLSKMPTGDLK